MNKIKVIVFDLGNVLLPFSYTNTIAELEKIENGFGVRFVDFFKDNYHIHRQYERGDMSDDDFLSLMLNLFEHKISKDHFSKIFSEIFTENVSLTSLLPKLKESYKLVLLSNTNSLHKKFGWEKYDFLKYFDELILSNEVNAVKPEERIYKCVENFTKYEPSAHLFIDDVSEYADAARKLGWSAIQYTVTETLKRSLDELEIKYH